MSLSGMVENPSPSGEEKFRHAGPSSLRINSGRHPRLAVGGKTQSLDSGLRRKDRKTTKSTFESTPIKSLGFKSMVVQFSRL